MSNLKKVLMLYGLIVFAANIVIISSSAQATIVYADKADVLKISPKPNIQCGEPGDAGDGRIGGLNSASAGFDSPVEKGTMLKSGQKQPIVWRTLALRSYLSILLRHLIWSM
jgi:hypothetical protein